MIRAYLKGGSPVDIPTGLEVEPTRWPAPAGCDGRAALEVVDADKNVVATFQVAELAWWVVLGPIDDAQDAPDGV